MKTPAEQIEHCKSGLFKVHSSLLKNLNSALHNGFHQHCADNNVIRTHLFNDRYENIYLNENQITELSLFLTETCRHASAILGTTAIKTGYWFNAMPPGAITTRHNHDDSDELLSAVYYVSVPPDSGDLILYGAEPPTRITPLAGQLIFFPPHIDHEVTCNNSQEQRLSIGINFGPTDEND